MNAIVYILFSCIIKKTFLIVPIWNFESSAIDLLKDKGKHEYNSVDRLLFNDFKITRFLSYDKGDLIVENLLYMEGRFVGKVNYGDIESAYIYTGYNNIKKYYVCPKGKYHVHVYEIDNNNAYEIKNGNFPENEDWDLHCYYQRNYHKSDDLHFLFIFYLGNKISLFQYNLPESTFKKNYLFNDGIYAYQWEVNEDSNKERQMFALIRENNKIKLKKIGFILKEWEDFSFNINNEIDLGQVKTNFIAFFKNLSYSFYWVNYNTENISDFESGFNLNENIGNNIDNFNIKYHHKSPFEFVDDVRIEKIKFIYGNKYVYYKLHNNDKNIDYHGVLDVVLNKIIFNTDEDILIFEPYSNNSMLAVTKNSIYKICVIRDENNDCIETCPNSVDIFDSSDYNRCGSENNCSLVSKPDGICIASCDEYLYYLKDKKECWLCKDLKDEGIFKLVNTTGCLREKIENSHFVNEYLNLIACDEFYKYDSDTKSCVLSKCHSNCNLCREFSNNDDDQKCIKCKNDLFYEQGNCKQKCSDNYYARDKTCYKCDNSCKSCRNENTCDTCVQGKFLNNQTFLCDDCSTFCESCSMEENNCLSCKNISDFKFLFNHTCVDKCPENMTFDSRYICVKKENSDKNDKPDKSGNSVVLSIYIIITGIILFLILFCFYKRYCCAKKDSRDKFLDEINCELVGKKNLIE